MKKMLFVLLGFISLNTYAHNCGGEFDPVSGSCRIIGSDGRQIIYNSDPPQSESSHQRSTPSKIIRHITVRVPSKYGALALDKSTGAIGDAVGADSLAQAKKAAIRQCNSKNCKVVAWVKNGCIAAAGGKLGKRWELINAAEERGEAERVAMARCKKAGISDCKIVVPEGCSIPDV